MKPLTFPARPINGGAFDPAVPKPGPWFAEPKYNGWRALVHAPTGTMWNRKGEQLSIAAEFTTALAQLQEYSVQVHGAPILEWFDCEALERRHNIGRGALIVLDVIIPGTYIDRRDTLTASCRIPCFDPARIPMLDRVFIPPSHPARDAAELYEDLKRANTTLGCEFYEGIVMKAGGSPYPKQLLSPDRETHTWVKHRWAW